MLTLTFSRFRTSWTVRIPADMFTNGWLEVQTKTFKFNLVAVAYEN